MPLLNPHLEQSLNPDCILSSQMKLQKPRLWPWSLIPAFSLFALIWCMKATASNAARGKSDLTHKMALWPCAPLICGFGVLLYCGEWSGKQAKVTLERSCLPGRNAGFHERSELMGFGHDTENVGAFTHLQRFTLLGKIKSMISCGDETWFRLWNMLWESIRSRVSINLVCPVMIKWLP